jgi:hypothetical protein
MKNESTVGELVLVPKNKTLFSCNHAHILHMPHAVRPYKLLTFGGVEPRMVSYDMQALLVFSIRLRRVTVCDCVKAWAMLRDLKRADYRTEVSHA